MNVLLIEDEPLTALELSQLVEELPVPIRLMAQLNSVSSAINWLSTNPPPDLIMSDVLLKDGLSFEIFDKLNLTIPVIYCTNYAEYALDSFNSHVIDYLLKPITAHKLAVSLNKFDRLTHYTNLDKAQSPYPLTFTVAHGAQLTPIPTSSIRYVYRHEELVYLRTKEHEYLLTRALDELEQILCPTDFYRANRQYLIHRNSIVSIELLEARKIGVVLNPWPGEWVVVSKAKAADFRQWL